MTNFASRLKSLRQSAGLTVAELAERAGLHRTHLYNLERGVQQPAWGTVAKLAAALDISTDAFLSRQVSH